MKKFIFVSLLAAGTLFAADKKAVFNFDFSSAKGLKLHRKAQVSNGTLKLSGKGDFASVPGTENVHISNRGITLIATVKLNDFGQFKPGGKVAHDMFFSKGREFIFGRSGKVLYVNFHDGKNWAATTMGASPIPGAWTQYAATIEYFNDLAQGEVGYVISIFVNGEREIVYRARNVAPKAVKAPVQIGNGFGGGPWFLDGEFASAKMYNYPMSEAEIAEEFSKEKRIKVVRKGFSAVSDSLKKAASSLDKRNSAMRFISGAVLRGAENGVDQKKLLSFVSTAAKFAKVSNFDTLAKKINSSSKDFKLIVTPDLAALTAVGRGKGNSPLLGVWNRKENREIFGQRTIFWQFNYRQGNKTAVLESSNTNLFWDSTVSNNKLNIKWQGKSPLAFTADVAVIFNGKRIETDIAVRNQSKDKILDEVLFPCYAFAKLPGKNDVLAYPYMSGVEVKNPTAERFKWGQEGVYPAGRATMQFGAYYNGKEGLYFGFEDGLARTKTFTVSGKRSNLLVQWTHPVLLKRGTKGGNSFIHNGKAVVEVYSGSWFEAGKIYRRFLEKDAKWWIKDLPRKSTPEWFRNNTLWILTFTANRKAAEDMRDTANFLRGYFELPFGLHWYNWEDNAKAAWPHFPAKDFVVEINRQIRENNIYTIPYIDSRLWKVKDGPDRTDYMYTSHGLKYAVRSRTGGLHQEDYGRGNVYTVICPAVSAWQDWLVRLVTRVNSMGFDGVYHDQVGTGRAFLCYAAGHGHDYNDSSLWLEKGYWKIFDKIFAVLHKKNRNFCHTTEENAEAYLKQFDGYLTWRWTDQEQIPLFQSIYAGRAQFVGKLYNHSRPGDKQSFFSKLGQQLVFAEQLGWFTLSELRSADARRLFVKKAMHVRLALLPCFNEGRMLEPMKFSKMPLERSLWGGNAPQVLTLPQIANSSWLGKDNSVMHLFVNTSKDKAMTAIPAYSSKKGFWICREGADKPVFSKTAPAISLKPLCFEIWVEGDVSVANTLQKTLKKISTFDPGKNISMVKMKSRKHKGVPGKFFGVKDIAGVFNCVPNGNTHIGWIQDGAVISFGEVDFGKEGASTISVKVTVDPGYAGGELEIRSSVPGKGDIVVGKLKLNSTGGWNNYREIPVKLSSRLAGKRNITFVINGNAACNFAGWKYLK